MNHLQVNILCLAFDQHHKENCNDIKINVDSGNSIETKLTLFYKRISIKLVMFKALSTELFIKGYNVIDLKHVEIIMYLYIILP